VPSTRKAEDLADLLAQHLDCRDGRAGQAGDVCHVGPAEPGEQALERGNADQALGPAIVGVIVFSSATTDVEVGLARSSTITCSPL
jgi:hypothetical protein